MKKTLLALIVAIPATASAAGVVRITAVERFPLTPRILPGVPLPIVSIGNPRIQLPAPNFNRSSIPMVLAPVVAAAPSAVEAVWVARIPAPNAPVTTPRELPSPRPKSILPPARRILQSPKGIELAALDRMFDNKGGKTPEPVAVPGQEISIPEQIAPSHPFTLPEHDLENEIGLPWVVEAE